MNRGQHAGALVSRAKEFAVNAHRRIGHRRKYTRLPYTTHLQNVVELVMSVTDDPEMIAAAWLHDVVEDTPATLEDVEKSFGRDVADMVASLTDISRPSDGNRAKRKELDRIHLAEAGAGAKTVKLADLIDNCRDICKNDERFAKQYLKEMAALLEVLKEGDRTLYVQAREAHEECVRRIGMSPVDEDRAVDLQPGILAGERVPPHLIRLFADSFIAQDIADPLRSFDREKRCDDVLPVMERNGIDVISVRDEGIVQGYLRRIDLGNGNCGDHLRQFRSGQVLDGEDSLTEVIHALTLYEYTFVSMLGDVTGLISRGCLNKPVARMWLFGMVT
ncbi:MAG: bifunctional (p)ppGpp synthetase/guanosine-3',5'-bis(diphosphate) 3'-pyrophosphohydrolase, partial [Nitrospiraceae bacterium]